MRARQEAGGRRQEAGGRRQENYNLILKTDLVLGKVQAKCCDNFAPSLASVKKH